MLRRYLNLDDFNDIAYVVVCKCDVIKHTTKWFDHHYGRFRKLIYEQ